MLVHMHFVSKGTNKENFWGKILVWLDFLIEDRLFEV